MKLLAAFILVLVNGFFVMAEFSLVKIRQTRLEELVTIGKDKRAALAVEVTTNFGSYLAAAQLGITLASLGLGWLGEPAIAEVLHGLFAGYFLNNSILLHTLSIVIAFFLITLFHVIIGEQVPKILAIEYTEKTALACVLPLYVFRKFGYIFIAIFDWLTRVILKLFGVSDYQAEVAHSEEEIRMILTDSQRRGVIDEVESEIIDNVFDFSERLAREIMRPRQEMVCLFIDENYEENIRIIKNSVHTRYPLCEGDKDNVIGMVHIRDIMQAAIGHQDSVNLRALCREVLMVPENLPVSKLLQKMKKQHIHLAVLVDEYGGTAGMVALEDIIEELVGEIQDETDIDEPEPIEKLSESCYRFDGKVLSEEVAEILGIELAQETFEEDTIGGVVFGLLGRRPEINDIVEINDVKFTVLSVRGLRIMSVLSEKLNKIKSDAG